MRHLRIYTVLAILLSGCQQREAPKDGAVPPEGKQPTQEELTALVPKEVGHVENPNVRDIPTPTDMPDFDGSAAKAKFEGISAEYDKALQTACAESPNQVIRVAADQTRLGYQSYKNKDLPVPGFFEQIAGYAVLGEQASGRLVINPLSLNSGDQVRDRKLVKLFFELENPANADLTFDIKQIAGELPEQDQAESTVTVSGDFTMHQRTKPLQLPLRVKRTQEGWVARLENPVTLLQLADFDLIGPLKALMASCNHAAMGDAVNLQMEIALVKGCPDQN